MSDSARRQGVPASVLIVTIALLCGFEPALARSIVITRATVIDGTGRTPVRDATVVIENGKITAVGPRVSIQIPRDAEVFDHRGKFVIPGLMDANVHLTGNIDIETLIRFEHDYGRIAVEAAQVALKSGVTTVFDTAGHLPGLKQARDRINRGEVAGSRIYFAGHIIGFGGPISSDHDDRSAAVLTNDFVDRTNERFVQGMGPELSWMGPEQVRPVIARYAAGPSDFLKYAASGHKQEALITFSQRVQNVIVDEGHKAGKTVQAHAISPESFEMALDAGADIITHCDVTGPDTLIPPETLAKMRRLGTYCSILPVTAQLIESLVEKRGRDDNFVRHNVISRQNDKNLIAAGIALMLSTDGWLDDPVEAAESNYPRIDSRIILGEGIFNALVALEQTGMAPLEILKTATINVAKGYKLDRDIGSIEVGKAADLVILGRDPLAAAGNYRLVEQVIKDGAIVDRAALPTDPVITSQAPSK